MGGSRFQTQAGNYAHKAITIPANGAAATLLSLIGALDLIDSAGVNLGDISKNKHRITGLRITAQAAAFQYGKTSAAPVAHAVAPTDLDLPVAGPDVLQSYFQSTGGGTVTATVLVFFD